MKQNEQIASPGKAVFEGTVAELAGRIEIGGEVLSQQEVQFLTRIGRVAGFATEVGFAEGTGTRGGKRAKIWSIKPGFRVSLTPAAQKAPAKRGANKAASAPAVDMSGIDTNSHEFHQAVAAAVAQLKKGQSIAASAPVKQTRQRRNKTETAATEAAPGKRSPGRPKGSKNASSKNASTEAAPAK